MSKAHRQKATPPPPAGNGRMKLYVGALVLIVAVGIADGRISNRWISTEALDEASQAMQNLPLTIGEWEGTDGSLTEQQLKIAEATGSLVRVYQHRPTGETVTVMLLCGPHGPISLHPPTVCFVGAGWELTSNPEAQNYADASAPQCAFWQASFARVQEYEQTRILTDWAWNAGNGWSASSDPRFEFAGAPFLYKLYVTSSANGDSEETRLRRTEFLRLLTAEFQRTVLKQVASTDERQG